MFIKYLLVVRTLGTRKGVFNRVHIFTKLWFWSNSQELYMVWKLKLKNPCQIKICLPENVPYLWRWEAEGHASCFMCIIYRVINRVIKELWKIFHVSHLIDWDKKWGFFWYIPFGIFTNSKNPRYMLKMTKSLEVLPTHSI